MIVGIHEDENDHRKHTKTAGKLCVSICKVEYLTGFKIVNGKYDINKPVWKTLIKKDFDSLTGIVVVRTKQYSNKLDYLYDNEHNKIMIYTPLKFNTNENYII